MLPIQITPEGIIVADIAGDIPQTPEAATKWLVGVSCVIVAAASLAVEVFVPATAPLTGVVSGAAIEVFCQVVFENYTLKNISWGKVAAASVSGALLAWVCPMLASGASKKVVEKLGMKVTNDALAKLAGYATLSFSTAVVSGANSAVFSVIDGKSSDEVFDSFLIGAAVGAGCSAAVSALSEIITKFGPEISKIVQKTMPNKWLSKINEKAEKISTFIGEHQVPLKNQDLENLLAPKSVYQATKSARDALNSEKNIFEEKSKT